MNTTAVNAGVRGGGSTTNEKKLEELIVHISKKCDEHQLFGAIKLNKILFFSDFFFYKEFGRSISGVEYRKLPHGPAPVRMKAVLNKLETSESIFVWPKPVIVNGVKRQQKRPIARREPDLDVFDGNEIEFVNSVIDMLQHITATEVSDMTHATVGWRLAALDETIPYCTAFLGCESDPLSAEDVEFGKKLAASLQ